MKSHYRQRQLDTNKKRSNIFGWCGPFGVALGPPAFGSKAHSGSTAHPEGSRLLDLVENFTLFSELKAGLVKIIGRNHQFLGVNNAIASMLGGFLG